MSSPATLLRGHPGWNLRPSGVLGRLAATDTGTWYARWDGRTLTLTPLGDRPARRARHAGPVVQTTGADELPTGPAPLAATLAGLGTVVHLHTDLWDALTVQFLRTAARDSQTHSAYRAWAAHGTLHHTPDSPLYAPPRPEQIPRTPPPGPAALPFLFLAEAAPVYLRHREEWKALDAHDLAAALCRLRGLGIRSAARAAADHTGDHTVYRLDDPALTAYARRAAHGRLPTLQRPFTELWQRSTPHPGERHALNLFTLAHGATRTTRPAVPAPRPHPHFPVLR